LLEINRLLHLFGLARRAGRLARGFDAAEAAMRDGTAAAVFLAEDISERTERNIRRVCEETGCLALSVPAPMSAIGHAIGCKPTGILALTDRGFAESAKKILAPPPSPTPAEN
jgi:ribosomal protein L7Ae-like RNA K-turn-binding protein